MKRNFLLNSLEFLITGHKIHVSSANRCQRWVGTWPGCMSTYIILFCAQLFVFLIFIGNVFEDNKQIYMAVVCLRGICTIRPNTNEQSPVPKRNKKIPSRLDFFSAYPVNSIKTQLRTKWIYITEITLLDQWRVHGPDRMTSPGRVPAICSINSASDNDR